MTISNFTYTGLPSRVIFGKGSLSQLEAEIDRLGSRRALVLSTPEQRDQAEQIASILGERAAGIFDKAVMHVPIETAREAREVANKLGADCAVAIGGGSTTGLGKAIALDSGLPILAIPTTYAGSEMTPVYGLTENGLKKTGKDPRVLPKTVIYDPELSKTLPVGMSVTSGMNAIAHAAEGLYAQDGNPVMALIAEEGIRAMAEGLGRVTQKADDLDARSDCLYGAWLCSTVLGNVGMALHHKLCHTLGGSFNLPHAQTHTVVLPHAIAYNAGAVPDAAARIIRALGGDHDSAGGALYDLAKSLGAPLTLRELGLTEADLDRATDIALSNPYWNPRPIEQKAIRELLQNAWEGNRPS
ncbi:maleylacetate reductase [Pseudomonas daroniae]|uniref:Maleylacetate reductase n=1 Tax=Phytopseudomonas daroniae TaxID=2487519 RepID=A0A4Q9QQM2_9GAMM|nr:MULTISPECIES: maleylacetate reductase [Pseudomonas]TBU82052.1 maleylacetate reductase [Pseudomonas daroniae]TBU84612.1 maleylacetate reductase [Pseudomonas sp. FRB 228]TBU92353.1 maleylacetate reductase [Pseudomonas daroniae]